jgi:Co/Zn/Cd efflux system component
MSEACCQPPASPKGSVDPRYRRILWIALAINVALFLVEIVAGLHIGAASLLADAVDFAGDAANYGLSLGVLASGVVWRSRVALVKGWTMTLYGLGVLAFVAWSIWAGVVPEPLTMGLVGVLALAANLTVAAMLFRFRAGDADMRSVWLCSRNDVIGNFAVMLAAVGVFGVGSGWPDHLVAAGMGLLALSAGISVVRHASGELRESRA